MTIPTDPTIETLAARVFATRDAAHRAHWRTASYSAHMALGSFYNEVIDQIDGIVECRQGEFGLIGMFTPEALPADLAIADHLGAEADWIASNRAALSRGSDALANLLDGLVGVYRTTVYKLRFLA